MKEFYDYELVKKYSICGVISLKSNFHRLKNMSDGFYKICKSCRKQ